MRQNGRGKGSEDNNLTDDMERVTEGSRETNKTETRYRGGGERKFLNVGT